MQELAMESATPDIHYYIMNNDENIPENLACRCIVLIN